MPYGETLIWLFVKKSVEFGYLFVKKSVEFGYLFVKKNVKSLQKWLYVNDLENRLVLLLKIHHPLCLLIS
jgi:hypothetical protein